MDKSYSNKKAVALSYKKGDIAPKVVAAGKGFIASKIIEKGKSEDVPFYEDKQLADELTKVSLGDSIPRELYEVVASILVFISDMDKMEEMRRYDD